MNTDDRRRDCAELEIEEAVLSYLGRHPQAADTLEGIANWWLPRQRYVTAQARIEAVLLQLVLQGELQVRRLPNGDALYTRNDEPR
ncbi:MAG: hypothetical protein HOP03_06745 [Lysobacter sp.]|nr:hypothetical protein [Lysobacter sp.]